SEKRASRASLDGSLVPDDCAMRSPSLATMDFRSHEAGGLKPVAILFAGVDSSAALREASEVNRVESGHKGFRATLMSHRTEDHDYPLLGQRRERPREEPKTLFRRPDHQLMAEENAVVSTGKGVAPKIPFKYGYRGF